MSFPYNAKNAASISCEIITWYAGGYAFIVYTAFGVSHFLLKTFVAFHIKKHLANEKE